MLRQEHPSAVSASGSWLIVFQLYALSHMHTHWQVIRVSDRMQAKPFSVFIHLPYIHYPEVLRTVTRGPRAPKACLTMTTDLWQPVSEAPPHHTCMFSSLFTLSVHLLCSLFCFFTSLLCFPPLSGIQDSDSNNLLSSWLFHLAPDPRAIREVSGRTRL